MISLCEIDFALVVCCSFFKLLLLALLGDVLMFVLWGAALVDEPSCHGIEWLCDAITVDVIHYELIIL